MAGAEFLVVGFWVLLAAWIGIDASVNSSQSTVLWILLTLLTGVVGVILYYLLGRDETGTGEEDRGSTGRTGRVSHICQSCGEQYRTSRSTDIDSCRNCGGIKVERVN